MYYLLRIFVWLALKIFCRNIRVNRLEMLQAKGPLVLACNHPNAFLDAIILGSLFHEPIHFLARGDAFRNPIIRRLLIAMHLIPVYRLTEGREWLSLNDTSFDRCQQVLSSGGVILIFSEGYCLNQWMLRPMKKGTARIALAAMNDQGISSHVQILPVSLNYNSFSSLGKTILIHFGEMISKNDLSLSKSDAEKMHHFNGLLSRRLAHGMLQSVHDTQIVQTLISNHHQLPVPALNNILVNPDTESESVYFQKLKMPGLLANGRASLFLNLMLLLILLIPSVAGLILHAPFYFPLKTIVRLKTKGTVFFDSVLFGALVVTYPVYWLLLNIIFQPLIKNEMISLAFLVMPLFAWISVYWRECFQKARNFFILSRKERDLFQKLFNK